MSRIVLAGLLCAAWLAPSCAATPPFSVEVGEDASADFPGAPHLHSSAFANWNGKWVFIGGRTNGYHSVGGGPAEFARADANDQVWVVDTTVHPARSYHAPLKALPLKIQDQWTAAAFASLQDGDTLYIAGGFGQDHAGHWQTYPLLSVVSLPKFVEGIIHGTVVAESVQSIESPLVQATGGGLIKGPGGNFRLVMGHVFTGSYTAFEGNGEQNTDHVNQIYLEEIRELKITMGPAPAIDLVERVRDPEFHRRDLNLVPVFSPQGHAYAVYGGVFTPNTQLNYSKPVYLMPGRAPVIDPSFEQKMHSYSTAHLSLYDKSQGATYTTFFGGISRFFWDAYAGAFTAYPRQGDRTAPHYLDGMQWNDQISTVAYRASAPSFEWVHPASLPGYLGTNAIFIPAEGLAKASPDILDFDSLRGARTLVGYLYGGIRASPYRFPYDKSAIPYDSGAVPTKVNDQILNVYVTVPPK